MKKKVWEKPKLVVLYRGKSEESVLQNCKTSTVAAGANSKRGGCWVSSPACNVGCLGIVTT